MSPAAARVLTGAAAGVVIAGVVGAMVAGTPADGLISLAAGFAVAVGWLIVRHDPRSPVGPALAWSTAGIALVRVNDVVLPDAPWSVGMWPVNLAGLLALLLVFPDGLRRFWPWRALPFVYAAATFGLVYTLWGAREVAGEVTGDELGGVRLAVGTVSLVLVGLCVALAAASLLAPYRSGDGRSREQIRWLMLAGMLVVVLLVGGWVAEAQGVSVAAAYTPFLAAIVVLVPAAVGIAIVRHDLFDVDRLLGDTATWVVTLVCSAGVFGLVVLGISQAFTHVSEAGPATAAFVAALVLLPLHQFVARFVGRFVDPERHVAVAAVDRFAADVRTGAREPEAIEAVLRDAQGDPALRVLLAGVDGGWVGLDGQPVKEEPGFKLESGGVEIARVILGRESARARRRIAELARAAWVPIEVSRLRLELHDALEETRASRARLAEAAAAERRRLERDLHDGAQQRLLATGMRLRLLQRNLPTEAAGEVEAAVVELLATVEELRRLANGVRPSRLDDGLAAALGAVRAATPLPFDLRVDALPDVDDTRALTAYLVVSEAVTNVLKHAHASRIDVHVAASDGRLAIRVSDDGIGGVTSEGALGALRDRVLSVGGELTVHSPADRGTTVEAML